MLNWMSSDGNGVGEAHRSIVEFDLGRPIERFQQLANDAERLRPYLKAELEKRRQSHDELHPTALAEWNMNARIATACQRDNLGFEDASGE